MDTKKYAAHELIKEILYICIATVAPGNGWKMYHTASTKFQEFGSIPQVTNIVQVSNAV